ncbi:MAG TPA: ABC transporter permease [Pyrinomonadaceae bacterium]|nr:ABC transporter permease [Pyrinomonadaceae bacterium]
MQIVIRDLRYASRRLWKLPIFTSIAMLTLALGIGANLTIFSFVDTMFFRPLPVRDPYHLVNVGHGVDRGFAYPKYAYLRDHNHSLESLAAHYSTAPIQFSRSNEESETVNGAVVSANYFTTLGINPIKGRFFTVEEDSVPDRDHVVVISHEMWRSHFARESSVVGKQIQLNGSAFTIVGVAPQEFVGVSPGYPNDLWIPTMMIRLGYRFCDAFSDFECGPINAIGRLNSDHSVESAQAELSTLSEQWNLSNPTIKNREITVDPALGVRAMDRPALSYQLKLMMTMTGVLLVIACANVAGLLLTAGTARRKEISVRLCLGAGRFRLVRQFLTESLLLTLGGGALGVLLSLWAKSVLLLYYTKTESYRTEYDLSLNPRTFIYALIVTIAAGLLFGLLPALQSSKQDLVKAIKDESSSQTRAQQPGRNALVIIQVALSIGLLVSAGLIVRSVVNIRKGQNFDPQNVVVMRLRPRLRDYAPEKAQSFTKEVLTRLRVMPGVEAVSLSKTTLVWPGSGDVRVRRPEQSFSRKEDQLLVHLHEIAPGLFQTLKLPLIQGRDFDERDSAESPNVVIVNETLTKLFWPNETSLERTLMLDDQSYRVVGVVKDAQFRNAAEGPSPFLYLPYWHNRDQVDATITARVAGDEDKWLPILKREIARIDSNVPIESITMSKQVNAQFKRVLLTTAVLIASGVIALFLSLIGLYAALSFAVTQRTREIGIRLALGAQISDMLWLVVGQGLRLVITGVVVGLLMTFVTTRLLRSLLYGVSATDPLTFSMIAVVVFVVGLLACYLPAQRATKVDPLVALRYE